MKWQEIREYEDILYHKCDGVAKVTINRPAKRNAFRPETVFEMMDAFTDAREDPSISVVLLTGAGPAQGWQIRLLFRRRPEYPRQGRVYR